MQGDKLQQKTRRFLIFLSSVAMQLPLSQGTGTVESELLQSSHAGVWFFGGNERLSQRLQKLETMTFYLYCFKSFTHMSSRDVLFFKIAVSAKNRVL